jgi:hypothetical protein
MLYLFHRYHHGYLLLRFHQQLQRRRLRRHTSMLCYRLRQCHQCCLDQQYLHHLRYCLFRRYQIRLLILSLRKTYRQHRLWHK